ATAPLAIVQAGRDLGGRALVIAATPAASSVAAGMTLAEARSLCPGLDAQPESPERVRAAAQAAVEAACAVSPRVEEAAPGLVHLDDTGLGTLFGDERGIARALVSSAERVGLCAAVGIAEGKSVALLAARAARPGRGAAPPHHPRGSRGHFRPAASSRSIRGRRGAGMGGNLARARPLPLQSATRSPLRAALCPRLDGARIDAAAPSRGRLL